MPNPKKSTGRKPGRPKAEIDWSRVSEMLEAGATAVGIAASIGIEEDTLRKRCPGDNNCSFSEFSRQKKAKGDEILREAQFNTAVEGSVPMQIWLGKQRLGQSDKQEISTDPRMNDLKSRIQTRAQTKGVSYEIELQFFLDHYADNVPEDVRTKLSSDLVQ